MRRVLLVGGAPRVPVDAVRHLTVHATGATALALGRDLRQRGCAVDYILSVDVQTQLDQEVSRYGDRHALDQRLQAWVEAHPMGIVVMSAAVNDYQVVGMEALIDNEWTTFPLGAKTPSGAQEVRIRLQPVGKLIDRIRSEWKFSGRLVGFKYEDARTVIASAQRLMARCGADVVVANSLDMQVQGLIWPGGRQDMVSGREPLLQQLASCIAQWAGEAIAN